MTRFLIPLLVLVGLVGVIFLLGRQEGGILRLDEETSTQRKPERIKVLRAKVSLNRDGVGRELAQDTEELLEPGDKITTDLNGLASLFYQEGTVARLGPSTTVTFEDGDTLVQEVGKVYVRFKKILGVQEEFEVENAVSVATVRGTAFASIMKPNRDPRFLVVDHEVELTPKNAKGERLTDLKKLVKKGEQAEISRTQRTIAVALQLLTDEEKEWLNYNLKSDETSNGGDLINLIKTVVNGRQATPSASPTGSPRPSATPTSAPPVVAAPPTSGYSRISVVSDAGTFTVSVGVGDISNTRVIVDTASDSDCSSNCPAMSLSTYVSRRGAFAGVNGTYFCPIDYATCAGKENTFDFLVMNVNKTYFNSDKNVYSTNPGVIFGGGYIRFVGAIQEWGRDTSPDGVLSNYPLLVAGGNVNFGGSSDPKLGSKGNRSFVANKGNLVYIGVVHNATVAESARVLKAMGMDNALNLDDGGSTALWYGGYKVGPGRNIPNAILFVSR